MIANLAFRLASSILALTSLTAWANGNADLTLERSPTTGFEIQSKCEDYLAPSSIVPFTYRSLRDMAAKATAEITSVTPARGFEDWHFEVQNEQVGLQGAPMALQQILPPGVSFVAVPGPTSPDPATIGATETSYSFPVHIDINWYGQRSSTTAYITSRKNVVTSAGGYIITPADGAVILHEHGGGTDKANCLNATSLGEYEVKRFDVSMVSVNMPGHGQATANPRGLTSLQGQVDWYMAMLDKLIAPGTKRVGTGHSWGAQFATYMWLHSDEEKYKDYIAFFPFAPPIDVSEGGDLDKKEIFSEELERRYDELWALAAPGDISFIKNIYLKNKDPNVPGWATGFSDLDYILPPLTPQLLARLKPATTFLSKWDLLTLVGREDHVKRFYGEMPILVDQNFGLQKFMEVFSNPNPQSEVYLFDQLETFHDVGLEKQGHQQFDAYIPGTKKYFIYEALGQRIRAMTGGPETPPQRAFDILDYTFRNFANYPAFRELVKHDVEYVESMPNAEKGARPINYVAEYINKYDLIVKKSGESIDAILRQSVDSLREQAGLRDPQTGELEKITYARAQAELSAPPLTNERRAALESYLAAMRQVDQELDGFHDSIKDAELAALKAKHAATLKALDTTFEDYKATQKKWSQVKIPKQKGQAKQDPMLELLADLSRMDQAVQKSIKDSGDRKAAERKRLENAIAAPPGISDRKMADQELNRVISPERTAALQNFVKAYGELEARTRAQAATDRASALSALPLPAGVSSIENARQIEDQRAGIENLTFVPAGNTQIAAIVERLKDAHRRKDELGKEPEQGEEKSGQEKSLTAEEREVQLRKQLSENVKRWAAMWDDEKHPLTNAVLDAEMVAYNAALDVRTATGKAYEARKNQWILEHRRRGLPDEEILNVPADLTELLNARNKAMNEFKKASDKLEEVRRLEAIKAPSSGPWAEAKSVALAIFGEAYKPGHLSPDGESYQAGQPSPDSLTVQLQEIEDYVEARRRELSIASQQIAQGRYEYAQALKAAGYEFPKTIIRVPIFELLNRPLPELQAMLSANRDSLGAVGALKGLKQKWDGPDAMLTSLMQTKAKGSDGAY